MKRRSSIRKRLERLEAVLLEREAPTGPLAVIEIGSFDGERHLVMSNSRCAFREEPGPGPTLKDFGKFSGAIYLSRFEARF